MFLEALPEDLLAEVLSSRQNQVAQTSNDQPQNDGDNDPEFLAVLLPDILEEVLAQQDQRLQLTTTITRIRTASGNGCCFNYCNIPLRSVEVLLTSPESGHC